MPSKDKYWLLEAPDTSIEDGWRGLLSHYSWVHIGAQQVLSRFHKGAEGADSAVISAWHPAFLPASLDSISVQERVCSLRPAGAGGAGRLFSSKTLRECCEQIRTHPKTQDPHLHSANTSLCMTTVIHVCTQHRCVRERSQRHPGPRHPTPVLRTDLVCPNPWCGISLAESANAHS